MKTMIELYQEMLDEKGKEELDQHWCMIFGEKVEKETKKEMIEKIEQNHRSYGTSIGGIRLPEQVWERVKKELEGEEK